MKQINAFMGIKYYENNANKKLIEEIILELTKIGINTRVFAKDIEKYGKVKVPHKKIMHLALKEIKSADVVIVEFSNKGVGVGMEAGIAFALKKPLYVIAKKGSEISENLFSVAEKVIFYNNTNELSKKLKFLTKR